MGAASGARNNAEGPETHTAVIAGGQALSFKLVLQKLGGYTVDLKMDSDQQFLVLMPSLTAVKSCGE